MGTLEHPEVTGAFSKVVNRAKDYGKALAVEALAEAGQLTVPPTEISWYKAAAQAELTAAMKGLKELNLPHIGRLERDQDQPINVVMAGLTLPRHLGEKAEEQADFFLKPDVSQLKVPIFAQPRHMLDPFHIEREVTLQRSLNCHATRCARKKGAKGKAVMCGIGAAHLPRSDGVPVSVATVDPKDAAILQQLEASKEETLGAGPSVLSRSWSI